MSYLFGGTPFDGYSRDGRRTVNGDGGGGGLRLRPGRGPMSRGEAVPGGSGGRSGTKEPATCGAPGAGS